MMEEMKSNLLKRRHEEQIPAPTANPIALVGEMVGEMVHSKVCMVFEGELLTDNSRECMLFIVNLECGKECDENVLPNIRISCETFSQPAICILGSKLFIFEGYSSENYNGDGKIVFTYELSESDSNLKLDKSMVVKEAGKMNDIKFWPKATATPNGKILVFSSTVKTCRYKDSDFELYDPVSQTCHKLPNLPDQGHGHNSIHVKAFTFLERSVFLVRTEVGVFTLDLDERPKNWSWQSSAFDGDECIPSHLGDTFVVIGRQICLTPYFAYDVRSPDAGQAIKENMFTQLYYSFPLLSSLPPSRLFQSAGVTLLNHKEQDFSVCLLQTGLNDETKNPELILQIYKTCLPQCMEKLSEYRKKNVDKNSIWWQRTRKAVSFPATSKVKSLKIVVPKQYDKLCLCYFSSLGF